MHPLLGSLLELSDDQLYTKHAELTKRTTAAYRLGYGDAINQLQLILADYQEEINRRSAKALEELQSRSKQFKNIIDIQ